MKKLKCYKEMQTMIKQTNKKASEYDHDIPRLQTADQPTATQERATEK